MPLTADTLTDSQITALRDAAGEAGDTVTVLVCEIARGVVDVDDERQTHPAWKLLDAEEWHRVCLYDQARARTAVVNILLEARANAGEPDQE